MIIETVIGSLGVAAMAALWLGVQLAWGRDFPGDGAEPDVLARRGGCGGCGHGGRCLKTGLDCEEGRS
ncbi:MAG: hypothetical protein OEV20_07085 [Actinomycetota bacterium]|nr:hypothetical protein [Actinomycetota bacterium]